MVSRDYGPGDSRVPYCFPEAVSPFRLDFSIAWPGLLVSVPMWFVFELFLGTLLEGVSGGRTVVRSPRAAVCLKKKKSHGMLRNCSKSLNFEDFSEISQNLGRKNVQRPEQPRKKIVKFSI